MKCLRGELETSSALEDLIVRVVVDAGSLDDLSPKKDNLSKLLDPFKDSKDFKGLDKNVDAVLGLVEDIKKSTDEDLTDIENLLQSIKDGDIDDLAEIKSGIESFEKLINDLGVPGSKFHEGMVKALSDAATKAPHDDVSNRIKKQFDSFIDNMSSVNASIVNAVQVAVRAGDPQLVARKLFLDKTFSGLDTNASLDKIDILSEMAARRLHGEQGWQNLSDEGRDEELYKIRTALSGLIGGAMIGGHDKSVQDIFGDLQYLGHDIFEAISKATPGLITRIMKEGKPYENVYEQDFNARAMGLGITTQRQPGGFRLTQDFMDTPGLVGHKGAFEAVQNTMGFVPGRKEREAMLAGENILGYTKGSDVSGGGGTLEDHLRNLNRDPAWERAAKKATLGFRPDLFMADIPGGLNSLLAQPAFEGYTREFGEDSVGNEVNVYMEVKRTEADALNVRGVSQIIRGAQMGYSTALLLGDLKDPDDFIGNFRGLAEKSGFSTEDIDRAISYLTIIKAPLSGGDLLNRTLLSLTTGLGDRARGYTMRNIMDLLEEDSSLSQNDLDRIRAIFVGFKVPDDQELLFGQIISMLSMLSNKLDSGATAP